MIDDLPRLVFEGPLSAPVAEWEIDIGIIGDVTSSIDASVSEMVDAFVLAGAQHGYPCPMITAETSRLSRLTAEPADSSILGYRLAVANVTAMSLQLLRNMLGGLAAKNIDVDEIIARESSLGALRTANELPAATPQNQDTVYPAVADYLCFQLEWSHTEFSMLRSCFLEMRESPTAKIVNELAKMVRVWGTLLECNAFALPVGPPQAIFSTCGPVSQHDDTTIQIEVTRYQAAEPGWNVLVNMLDVFSRQSASIVKVVVE